MLSFENGSLEAWAASGKFLGKPLQVLSWRLSSVRSRLSHELNRLQTLAMWVDIIQIKLSRSQVCLHQFWHLALVEARLHASVVRFVMITAYCRNPCSYNCLVVACEQLWACSIAHRSHCSVMCRSHLSSTRHSASCAVPSSSIRPNQIFKQFNAGFFAECFISILHRWCPLLSIIIHG